MNPAMSACIGLFDNPLHGVTGDDGRFELKGLTADIDEVEAWHETYGTQSPSVSLHHGEMMSVGFHFGA